METKPIYASKTFWFNVLAVIVMVAGYFGFSEFTPNQEYLDLVAKIMAAVVPLANIVLRSVTSKGVTLT